MANTFTPAVALGVVGGNVPVFQDSRCTIRATVLNTKGNALLGNALVVPQSGLPPVFECALTTVYFKRTDGSVVSLTSAGVSTVMTNTGATIPNLVLRPEGV